MVYKYLFRKMVKIIYLAKWSKLFIWRNGQNYLYGKMVKNMYLAKWGKLFIP